MIRTMGLIVAMSCVMWCGGCTHSTSTTKPLMHFCTGDCGCGGAFRGFACENQAGQTTCDCHRH
jgi:hypothetical protein